MNEPYKGITPFKEEDEFFFFGRDNEIDSVLGLIEQNRFCAIVGFSGTGKSSLVNAGIIPNLNYIAGKKNSWEIIKFRPSDNNNNPIKKLAQQIIRKTSTGENIISKNRFTQDEAVELIESKWLRSSVDQPNLFREYKTNNDSHILIFVDQFEEIHNVNRLEAQQLVNTLISFSNSLDINVHILLTMRADSIHKLIHYRNLTEAFNQSIYFVPRITEVNLEKVISYPAKRRGKELDLEIITTLINAKNQELNKGWKQKDDTLPLLQYFLMLMWNADKKSKTYTIDNYKTIGPLRYVIDKKLDEVYYDLKDQNQRTLTEFIFRNISKNGKDISQSKSKDFLSKSFLEIHSNLDIPNLEEELNNVISIFMSPGINILKYSGDEKIEVVHEAVFRNWKLCKSWLEEEAKKVEILADLLNYDDINVGESEVKDLEEWKVKEFMDEIRYLSSKLWVNSKSTGEYYEDNYSYSKIKPIFDRVRKWHFMYLIQKASRYQIHKIVKTAQHNNNLLVSLTENDIDKFEKSRSITNNQSIREYYWAIYPEDYFKGRDGYTDEKQRDQENIKRWKNTNLNFTSYTIGSNEQAYSIIQFACIGGNLNHIKKIIDFVENPEDKESKEIEVNIYADIFRSAIYSGHIHIADYILNKNDSLDYKITLITSTSTFSKRSSILIAAMMGQLDYLKKLLKILYENKIQIDQTPIYNNSSQNFYRDIYNNTPLHYAGYTNYSKEVIEEFINRNCTQDDIALNSNKQYPIHIACQMKSLGAVKTLISDMLKKDKLELLMEKEKNGFTPLMLAIMDISDDIVENRNNQKISVLRELMKYKDSLGIEFKEHDGFTALLIAVGNNDYSIVKILLENGANPNSQINSSGNSSIHVAIHNKNIAILKLILESQKQKKSAIKLDFDIKNDNNLSPIELAALTNFYDGLNLLYQNGAKINNPFWHKFNDIELKMERINPSDLKIILQETLSDSPKSLQWPKVFFGHDSWEILNKTEAIEIFTKIVYSKQLIKSYDITEVTALRVCDLNFYSDAKIYEVLGSKNDEITLLYFILHPNGVIWLSGSNSTIFNHTNPILKLTLETPEQALGYAKFFYSFVNGPKGAFSIVESYDELQSSKIKVNTNENLINKIPKKATVNLLDNEWEIETIIVFMNSLFYAKNIIDMEGNIRMKNENILVSEFEIESYTLRNYIRKRTVFKTNKELRVPLAVFKSDIVINTDFLGDFRRALKDFESLFPVFYSYQSDKIIKKSKTEISDILENTLHIEEEQDWCTSCFDKERWSQIEKSLGKEILSEVICNKSFPITNKSTKFIALRSIELSFYKSQLYQTKLELDDEYVYISFVKNDKSIYFLDGTANQIYHMNKELHIELNNDNTKDYFKFFNHEIFGGKGYAFNIIDSYTSLKDRNIDVKEYTDLIPHIIKDVEIEYVDTQEYLPYWRVYATVNHKNELFYASYVIQKSDAKIQMVQDLKLVSNFEIDNCYYDGKIFIKERLNTDNTPTLDFSLPIAAKMGYLSAMKWLHSNGKILDINYQIEYSEYIKGQADKYYMGKTALIVASEDGNLEMVSWLVDQDGIDLNIKDTLGETALMKAKSRNYKNIVKLLTEKGAKS